MYRIVFFGMNGGFSTTSLAALAGAQLKPALVVRGVAAVTGARSARVDYESAQPSWLDRLRARFSKSEAGVEAPPAVEEIAAGAVAHEIDLARAAHVLGVDVVTTSDANAVRVRAQIAKAEPDALVVAGFPHLLSKDVLALPKRGGVNLHPGKLPEERGPSPLFWALRNGRTSVTFTVHMLDAGEDSGDIISSGEVRFEPGADGEEVLVACARAASPHLVRAVRGLLEGDLIRMPQAKERAGRCPRPTFRDGLIDAGRTAREVYTFVAGCARTHSVFAECGGDRFFVARAVSYDEQGTLPCEYVLTGDRLLLRCTPGVVELELKVQGAIFSAEYTEAPGST
jgi:methionyl-tRNA formyltransferase